MLTHKIIIFIKAERYTRVGVGGTESLKLFLPANAEEEG